MKFEYNANLRPDGRSKQLWYAKVTFSVNLIKFSQTPLLPKRWGFQIMQIVFPQYLQYLGIPCVIIYCFRASKFTLIYYPHILKVSLGWSKYGSSHSLQSNQRSNSKYTHLYAFIHKRHIYGVWKLIPDPVITRLNTIQSKDA